MSFDIFGRLLTHRQTTDSNNYDTSYTYNLGGALTEEAYPSGRVVKNTFDQDGNLSQVQSKKNSGSGYWTYADAISRDSSGNVKKMQLGNGRWETADYNSRGQIMQIGLGTTDSTQDLLKLEYKYDTNTTSFDNNGSMREQKITVPATNETSGFTATQTYLYDDLNRLASAEEKVSGSTTWKQTFSIDRYGNRRFDTSTSGLTTTLGSCSTAVCNPTISTSTNRISSSGYTFDANGSMTANAAGERFGYDAEKHQTAFFLSTNSGSTPDATYTYDGEGRRVKKVSSTETTIFVYDGGGQMIAEYSTALATTPQVSYLTQDHLGSPRVITNENGAVTGRKDYAAFGDETTSAARSSNLGYASTSGDELRKGYTGYEKDSESGLDFAQARYYNPTHGRYTSIDPMTASATIKNPQTFNRYSYVLNSPYKFNDPLGLISSETGACGQWCRGSGPYVDGRAFRGRDAKFNNLESTLYSYMQRSNPPPPPPPPAVVVLFWGGSSSIDGKSSSDVNEVVVGGDTGGLGEKTLGFETAQLANRIKNDFPEVLVIAAGPDALGAVFKRIADSGSWHILIAGYSSGAYTAVNLANTLVSKGYDVDQVTTVDPTTIAVVAPNLKQVGTHIGSALNYWREGDGTTVRGEGVLNIQLFERDRQKTTTPFVHVNMLDIASPKVLSQIENGLRYIQQTQ